MKRFNKIVAFLLVLCMVLSVAPQITIARAADADANLWIDPVNGNDANDGTTEGTALKTIQAAKTKAAELSANGDVVVILKGGTYDATETIVFGAAESGKNGNTITYRAAAGETALISGGKELDGWTLHDAANNIYVTDIPEGAELTRQFYVNGEPQPMAATELTPMDWSTINVAGYRSEIISNADSTQYITIDLGSDKLVSSVVLYGDSEASATTGKAVGFPEDFTIQTSANGYTWTTQVTETGYTAPEALGGVEFVFTSTAARYIKINATKLGNPGSNAQTGDTQHRLAFAEVQVGFTSKANTVNLGVAQHIDMDSSLASASDVTFAVNTPYALNLGSNVIPVAGVSLNVNSLTVGTTDNVKVQVTTDGSNWKTVYTKNGYVWQSENFFAFNTTGATAVRVITATAAVANTIAVHGPATLAGSVTATGTGASNLTDGVLGGSFKTSDQTSSVYSGEIVVNLGSVQDVAGVRLYPTYTNGKVAGYIKAARILVSTDGVTYNTALELPEITTPTSGAQVLVFPRGYKAQYVKIVPMMLTEGTDGTYSLQLDELEIVPSKIDAINVEDDVPNVVTKQMFENISWSGATPILGYYDNASDLSGTPIDHQAAAGEDACIIDGKENSRGVTGDFNYDELVKYGGTKVPAFYVTLAEPLTFNSLELKEHEDLLGAPLSFTIEAYNGTEWVELVNETSSPWTANTTYSKTYTFDAVTANAVRILIYDVAMPDGSTPDASVADDVVTTQVSITELTLANMTEITYEETPDLDADTVAYDKVSLSGANVLGFGYYKASDMNELVGYNQGNAGNIVDGNEGTYGSTNGQQYQWMPDWGGSNIPALVLSATKKGQPSTINAIELVVREDGLCAPYDFEIQVTTTADYDNWITVAKGEEVEWKTNTSALYKFTEMDVYKVRLIATNLTPASNIPREEWKEAVTTYLQIAELSLYNINDPTNPIAVDLVSQGTGATGSIIYDAKSATASSDTSSYNANRAVDGFIESMENAGFSTGSAVKYNLANLWHPENVEMHTLYLWYHRITHFTSATNDGTEIYMADGLPTSQGTVLMPTWISNDYIFIDTPGEWYIDRYEGKIYYKADGTMDDKVAILPVTETIVDMEYAQNIKFEGITFSHTTWTYPSTNEYRDQQSGNYLLNNTWMQVPAGIELSGCTNVVFDGVQIRNMGTSGIRIKSDGTVISEGCKVINSLICDISYNGINVGEVVAHHGYRGWQLVKNATIQNNYITRIGIDMFDSVGILAAYTNGVVIDHNEIAYTPYSGISLGWGWEQEEVNTSDALTEVGNNQVTNNYIHDVCKTNYDGGAIYTLGWQQGSVISGNYIHDSGTTAGKTENAIYLDQGTAYMTVTGNVIDTVAQSWLQIWFENIHDNTSTGNYYNSALSTRGIYVNYGNTTSGNTSFSSLASNASAKAIADAAGLTDNAFKADNEAGFTLRQDITQNYWGHTDYARNIYDYQGWYNVRISGQVGTTSYDNVNKVATIVMPEGTDLSALVLQYSNESGWNITPGTGTTQNFTSPVTYTITSAGGGTTKTWTVNVVTETAVVEEVLPPVNDDPTVETIPTEAPTEPEAPAEGYITGTYLQIIPESSLLPYVGEYQDENLEELVNQDPGEAKYLTDSAIGVASWIGNSGASGINAAVIEVTGGAKMIGGVELIAKISDKLTGYEIQVKKTDGTWVSVATEEDGFDGTCTELHTFEPVLGTAIRVLCHSWSSNRPMLQEITLYEAKTGNILQEVVPAGVTSSKGPFTPTTTVDKTIDGDRGNWNAAYFQTNQTPVVLTFDMTKDGAPSNVARMILYAYDDDTYTAGSIKLEAQTDAEGTWVELYDDIAYDTGFEDTFILDFDAVDAYAMRLTVNNFLATNLILTEVDFFGYVKEAAAEPVQLPAPTGLAATEITDSSITVTADAIEGGTLMFRINEGEWQTSGTFTGLTRYTKYTVEAMYVGAEGYIDSDVSSITERTAKTQLTAPTGLTATEVTENSITVTADTITGGNLRYRINGGAWQTSGTFTDLTDGTTYTIEAKYAASTGYSESAAVAIEVTTVKADVQLSAPTGLTATATTDTITATADAIEGGTLMFRIDGGAWQTSGTFTGLTDNTTYTVEAMYVGAEGYIDSAVTTITVTTEEAITGPVIVETNALAGVSFSVRLLEPWAMRVTVTYYQGQQPNHKKLTLANLESYGAYAILGSKFEAAENATLEDLLNDPDTIHFEQATSAEEGKIYPINATQAMFDFYDGLYTYRLNEAVYMVTYYEDAEGLHFSRVRSKTLVETIDGLKNLSEKESNVYTSMKAMEASVTAYRATLPSSALGTVYPAGLSVAESGIPFGADPAPGSYKFGTSVSIKLIEPWGIKADIRIVNSSNQNINYSNADDYGMIFFHDKDGKYADTGMTADDILAEAGAQVYANSLGNVTLANSRMTAIYDQGIFTYQMDSTLYCMPFVVINGQYYYRNTGAISWNLIAQVEKFAGETTRSAEEIAVYNAMISMNENILIYRGQ